MTAEAGPLRPLLVTIAEAAELLRVGQRTLEEWIATGELRSLKIGRSRRVAMREVDRFIAELEARDAEA